MTFTRNLEFYELSTDDIDFPAILNEINEKEPVGIDDDGKIVNTGTFQMAITNFVNDEEYAEGIITRVTNNDIPMKGSLARNVFDEIELAIDEGIADMTFFCYIKELSIICLLPASNGVKWGTFTYYLNRVHDACENLDLLPLLNPETVAILQNWRSITSVEAEVGIGNNIRPNAQQVGEMPLGLALDEVRRMQSTRLKLELYNPKRDGGLAPQAVRRISTAISRMGGVWEPKHINVKGSPTPEVKDTIIDLISQKYKLQVTLGNSRRHLVLAECQTNVHGVIEDNYEQIETLVN